MNFRPLNGFIDNPSNGEINDIIDLKFDYQFMGKRNGEVLDLLVHSWVIDFEENVFSRKGNYLIKRIDAVECITTHVRTHLKVLGIADMQLRSLMRDFKVDSKKTLKYDPYKFSNNL